MPHDSLLDPDNELPVDEDTCVVSLLRKPESDNPEHAFLVVEGENSFGKIIFMRYDLVIDEASDDNKYKINIRPGNEPEGKLTYEDVAAARVGLIQTVLQDRNTVGRIWSIAKTKALALHNNVLKCIEDPGTYNLFGIDATIPKSGQFIRAISPTSGKVSSTAIAASTGDDNIPKTLSEPGHNCFTWARWQLFQLDIPPINQRLPRSITDLIASVTSRHLRYLDSDEPTSGNCVLC